MSQSYFIKGGVVSHKYMTSIGFNLIPQQEDLRSVEAHLKINLSDQCFLVDFDDDGFLDRVYRYSGDDDALKYLMNDIMEKFGKEVYLGEFMELAHKAFHQDQLRQYGNYPPKK